MNLTPRKRLRVTKAHVDHLSQVKNGAAVGSNYALFQSKNRAPDGSPLVMDPLPQGPVADELAEDRASGAGWDVFYAFADAIAEAKSDDDRRACITELAQLLESQLCPDSSAAMAQHSQQENQMNVQLSPGTTPPAAQPTEENLATVQGLAPRKHGLFGGLAALFQGVEAQQQANSTDFTEQAIKWEDAGNPVGTPPLTQAPPNQAATPAAQSQPTNTSNQAADATTPTPPGSSASPALPQGLSPEGAALLQAMQSVIAPLAQTVSSLAAEVESLKKTTPAPGSRQPDFEQPIAQQAPAAKPFMPSFPMPPRR